MPLNPLTPLDACFLFMKSFRVLDIARILYETSEMRSCCLNCVIRANSQRFVRLFLLFEKKIVTELHEMDQKFSHCVEEYNLEFVVTNDKENHLIF